MYIILAVLAVVVLPPAFVLFVVSCLLKRHKNVPDWLAILASITFLLLTGTYGLFVGFWDLITHPPFRRKYPRHYYH